MGIFLVLIWLEIRLLLMFTRLFIGEHCINMSYIQIEVKTSFVF